MAKAVKAIPDAYTAVTPYITVKGADEALRYYREVFGAEETYRLQGPDGKVVHAEIRINGAAIMLNDEAPQWQSLSPLTIGGSASTIMLYVQNVDETIARAVKAGATATMPVTDMFYGDRSGGITDPFGHKWNISTHIEDVTPEELAQRAKKMFASGT